MPIIAQILLPNIFRIRPHQSFERSHEILMDADKSTPLVRKSRNMSRERKTMKMSANHT